MSSIFINNDQLHKHFSMLEQNYNTVLQYLKLLCSACSTHIIKIRR